MFVDPFCCPHVPSLPQIGPFEVPAGQEKAKLKVKVRMNLHGLTTVEGADNFIEVEEEVSKCGGSVGKCGRQTNAQLSVLLLCSTLVSRHARSGSAALVTLIWNLNSNPVIYVQLLVAGAQGCAYGGRCDGGGQRRCRGGADGHGCGGGERC